MVGKLHHVASNPEGGKDVKKNEGGLACAVGVDTHDRAYNYANAGGSCGRAYECAGGGGACGRAYECAGGGGVCGRAYACTGS